MHFCDEVWLNGGTRKKTLKNVQRGNTSYYITHSAITPICLCNHNIQNIWRTPKWSKTILLCSSTLRVYVTWLVSHKHYEIHLIICEQSDLTSERNVVWPCSWVRKFQDKQLAILISSLPPGHITCSSASVWAKVVRLNDRQKKLPPVTLF